MLDPHLDPKTQLLVALGAATAAKCQACFIGLYATANEVEATDKEIRAVVAIANKVAAKSRDFMSTLIEETTKGAVAVSGNDAQSTGCECR
jgi:alkylhydroperoxidase/carboxymuconolactone decarboxylase family protein YurZ